MTSARKIKNWMNNQSLQDLNVYVDDAGCPNYTALAEDASAHFCFENNSLEDEMCFELAVDVLDRYIKLMSNGF